MFFTDIESETFIHGSQTALKDTEEDTQLLIHSKFYRIKSRNKELWLKQPGRYSRNLRINYVVYHGNVTILESSCKTRMSISLKRWNFDDSNKLFILKTK